VQGFEGAPSMNVAARQEVALCPGQERDVEVALRKALDMANILISTFLQFFATDWRFRRIRSLFPRSCRSPVPRSCRSDRSEATVAFVVLEKRSVYAKKVSAIFSSWKFGLSWTGA
jgi:hypothetical protein